MITLNEYFEVRFKLDQESVGDRIIGQGDLFKYRREVRELEESGYYYLDEDEERYQTYKKFMTLFSKVERENIKKYILDKEVV